MTLCEAGTQKIQKPTDICLEEEEKKGKAEHLNGAENGTFGAQINVCNEDVKSGAGGTVQPRNRSGSDILSNVKCCQRTVGGML